MSDLDPNSREMREQIRALRGLADASVSRKLIACELSEALGGSVEGWKTRLGRASRGLSRLSLGAYRVILQRLDSDADRLAIARAAHVDLDLVVDTATYTEPDDLQTAAVDTMRGAVEGLDGICRHAPSASIYRAVADMANSIAASLEHSDSKADAA